MRTEAEWKNLEAERDALAARVQEMRVAIKKCRFDSLNMTFADLDYIKRAFATPDTSAQILARRDAATIKSDIDDIQSGTFLHDQSPEKIAADGICRMFERKINELLKRLEKQQ